MSVPSSEWAPPAPPPLLQASAPPPPEPKGWGQHSPAGEGAGGEPIRMAVEKAWNSVVYSVYGRIFLPAMAGDLNFIPKEAKFLVLDCRFMVLSCLFWGLM